MAEPTIVVRPNTSGRRATCSLCDENTTTPAIGIDLYVEGTTDLVCESCALKIEPVLGMLHNQLGFLTWLEPALVSEESPPVDDFYIEQNAANRATVGLLTAAHAGDDELWHEMVMEAVEITPAMMFSAFAELFMTVAGVLKLNDEQIGKLLQWLGRVVALEEDSD